MKIKRLYRFYVDILFYLYCQDTMQTVSLVEKIIEEVGELYLFELKANFDVFKLACLYIEHLFDIKINKYESENVIVQIHEGENVLPLLKENARSNLVKNYFGL